MVETENNLQPFHNCLLHRWRLFYLICSQQLLDEQRAAFTGKLKKKSPNVINSVENDKS